MAMRRQICERAVFDGTADDPRVLMHWYQQRMRAQLLASVALENAQPVVEVKPSWATYLSSLTSAVTNAFRSLMPARAAQQIAAPARMRLAGVGQPTF
jgi:hypothetical protein